MLDKTDEKLATLIEKLQEAGLNNAPEVIDGAIRAIYFDGMLDLIVAGVFIFLMIVTAITFVVSLNKNTEEGANCSAIGFLISIVFALLFGVAGNPWLDVFDPQAAFYQQIMNGILN